ncbi:hypothetical protein EXIGLDRAFT_771049 [Exidia glandulosa HHB12029]|uniref:Uncharacterized protein n=1 Tax=Exidia glandulosa HHB12029 TaxID=1314781 RepID=A0A165G9Y3_EXIGL|nr:hypothetical protein EXIGLDRAFT_771049 [Exidia glandulosa HHB12029]
MFRGFNLPYIHPNTVFSWPLTCKNKNKHAHTQLSRQAEVFKNATIAQEADIASGVVSFYDPTVPGSPLSPFQGVYIQQANGQFREVSPRSYEAKVWKRADLRRIHCHCCLDADIPLDASLALVLEQNGEFRALCHTYSGNRGCGMNVALSYYSMPPPGCKNTTVEPPVNAVVVYLSEDHAEVRSSRSSRRSSVASSRPSSASSSRGRASSRSSHHTAASDASPPPSREGSPLPFSATRPRARANMLLAAGSDDAVPGSSQAGPSRKRHRTASIEDFDTEVDAVDESDPYLMERRRKRDLIASLVRRASDTTEGLAPAEVADLQRLIATEFCSQCDRHFLCAEFRKHIRADH